MSNIIPHLGKHFFFVCEGMLSYDDGKHIRKNRRFLKALWSMLREKNSPTVEEVIARMNGTYADTTKQMIKSNIKRGGWQWLEGTDGNIFGERFANEYVRRCELLENNELIEVIGGEIDRINHHNFPALFPDVGLSAGERQ